MNASRLEEDAVEIVRKAAIIEASYKTVVSRLPELAVLETGVRQMMGAVDDVREATRYLCSLVPRGRVRRGWINGGGYALKVVFGTPDADDLEDIQRDLGRLNARQEELVHIAHEQLTLTRSVGRQTERVTRELAHLAEGVRSEMVKVETGLSNLHMTAERLESLMGHSLTLSSNLYSLHLGALKALGDVRELYRSLEQVSMGGSIGYSLIRPTELSSILMQVAESLPPELRLIAGTQPSDAFRHLAVSRVRGVVEGGTIKLILDLPLQEGNRRFDLYRVRPVPVVIPDTHLPSVVQLEEEHFAVSQDGELYALLSDADLQSCRKGELLICPAGVPLFERHRPTCVSALYFGDVEDVKKLCAWTVLLAPHRPILFQDPESKTWTYSLASRARTITTCRGGGVAEDYLQGVGTLSLAAGCAIRADGFRLLPTSEGEMSVTLKRRFESITLAQTPLSTLSSTRPHLEEAGKLLLDEGEAGRGHWGAEETRLGALLFRVEQLDRWSQTKRAIGWGGSGVAGVSLLVVLFVVVWRRWSRGRRGRAVPDTTPATREPDIPLEVCYPGGGKVIIAGGSSGPRESA